MRLGCNLSEIGRGFVMLATGATAVVAALLLTTQAGGAPAPTPVVMTDVCVNPAQGQMSFPVGATCPAGYATVAVDDPGAIVATCYLNSNGAIRKVSGAAQCSSAPRSKKETALQVPSLTTDLYFCASLSDGALFFKGTDPVTCKSGQFLVVVEQANSAPVAAAGTLTTLEDTVGATTLSATDEDGDSLTFAIASQGTKGTAALTGSVSCDALTPSMCTRGASYTPQANVNGSDSFTFTASDSFATSAPAAVAVTITPVNDAPSFTKGADQTVAEDAGAQSVAGWATAISAGPANESGQTVSFSVTGNSNPGLFSTAPAVSPDGALTYTPAANASGSATIQLALSDDGGTANGGVDTSPAQSFTITVTAVNDAPSFTKGADETVLEDAGAQTAAGWATGISAGPADEAGQTVTFTITGNTNPSLFASGPAVASNGTLSYTPAANAFGSVSGTLDHRDHGAPPARRADQRFTITVTPVNDAPSFDAVSDPAAVDEDATAQSIPGFATGMSAGPANEAGQALQFEIVSNSNPSLFAGLAGLPLVSAGGTLTYTPAPNANGTALIAIRLTDDGGTANGGVDESATQQFTITVTAVNDPPSFQLPASPDQTVLEDAGAQSVAGFATAISKGPADESGQTLTFNVSNDNNALFSVQPDIDETSGDLTYTPAANANGSATVTVTLSDDGGGTNTSGTATFEIDVSPVNDEPSFDLPASPNQTVAQDGGAQTVPGFATNISAGPANESGQTLTFTTSNDNNALFSAQPAISSGGTLTYTPAAGATGTATVSVSLMDDGGTANGGDDTSPTQTFTITIAPPNAAPVANAQSVNATEDGAAVPITLTASDADDDALSFSIVASPAKGSLGSLGAPDCSAANTCSATVSYTPAANENGADSFTFKVNDGTADSNTATVSIDIAPINDAPSFTKGADDTVLEDSGARTVNGWATSISAGPANESGQTVTFTVTNNTNAALFAVAPSVDSSGDLSYTPAANAFGTATITLKAVDNGTPPAESPTQDFVVNVTGVNDAPSFTKGGDQTVAEDAGAQSVAGWATGISAGPSESGQTVSFVVTNNTNAGLFSAAPAVSSAGTLTYTPAANQHGTATITLKATDDGGTANGGVDESATQQFTITVTAVNDAPVATNKSFDAQANMKISIPAGGLLAGATDPDDVAGNPGWAPTFTVGTVSATSPAGGNVSFNASTGAFDFDPPPGASGSVSFTYTVCDNGEGAPASACSAPATVTFAVAAPVIWFVNPNAAVNGNGTLSSPFNTLAGADAVDAAGHRVFVYTGPTTTGLALNSGEWLIGQGATGASFDALMGISPPTGTIPRPSIGGTRPTIGGTVALSANTRVQGLNITTTGVTALSDSVGSTGVSVSEANLNASNAAAVELTGTGGTIALDATTSSGSPGSGIGLTNVAAAFTGGSGAITNAAGADVAISGGNGTFDYNGSITDDLGALVTVAGTTGGAKSFDGVISDGNDGDGSGISLTANNAATTVNFTATLMLSTGSNPAFTATGGGTVNVTGPANTIATTTGTALNVANTTIGVSGLTFRSISSNGAVNGIVLNNTGTSGGLTVTGNSAGLCGGAVGSGPPASAAAPTAPSAADCSGGTIQNSTGTGILLAGTSNVSVTRMRVTGSGGDGIGGTNVTGFTLANSLVEGNGNAVQEANVDFGGVGGVSPDGLHGTGSITNSTVRDAFEHNVAVRNSGGTPLTAFNVTGSQFSNVSANAASDDGIQFEAGGTANMTASVTGSFFAANRGDHFQAAALNSGTMNVTFTNNTLTGGHATALGQGITINAATGVAFGGYSGRIDYDVNGNNIQGAISNAVTVNLGTSGAAGVFDGFVRNNIIGTTLVGNPAAALSCSAQANGVSVEAHGNGTHNASVTGNTMRQCFDRGIISLANDGNGSLNLTVSGNDIKELSTDPAGGREAFNLVAGATSTNVFGQIDSHAVCLALTSAAGNMVGGLFKTGDIRVRQRFRTSVRLPGYAGTAFDTTAVVNFLQANNPGTTATATANDDAGVTTDGYFGGAACTTPS